MRASQHLSREAQRRILNVVAESLFPTEVVIYLGRCVSIRPALSHFVVTDRRILGLHKSQVGSIRFAHALDELAGIDVQVERGRLVLRLGLAEELIIGGIPAADMPVVEEVLLHPAPHPEPLREPAVQSAPLPPPLADMPPVAADEDRGSVGSTRLRGRPLWDAAQRAIDSLCLPGEQPWLVLNPGGFTGCLAAFDDRLVIVKVGAMTGFAAGTLFGGRTAVLYYVDITGIEFNVGLLNGVLEILTASYQGTANKDFWQGTFQLTNANSNNPFTLSNTLPMLKTEYREWSDDISELRRRIAELKRPSPAPPVTPATPHTMSAELLNLAGLHADGVLSDEEFAAAKAKVLGGPTGSNPTT